MNPELDPDLKEALQAICEIMGYDKGPREDEWVEWANRYLPLVHRHGYLKWTVGFS